ncbi:major facilitator superfamily domain-containing protein [Trichoderma austrokoningii]
MTCKFMLRFTCTNTTANIQDCTPYLLNLGLTKANTSLVWIAGPLSGLIVQPIVGVVADESTSRWGRRRPLMMAGAVIVSACLLVLGFTREIVGGDGGDATRRFTVVLAVVAIYAMDFAINAIMSCSRSLIVDTLPLEKQGAGAAWGSRMNSVGHMIGYGAGSVDLVRLFGPSLGDSQFKQLTVIAAMAILGTTAVTCWAVTERVLQPASHHHHHHLASKKPPDEGPLKVFHQIRSTLQTLPPRVQAICWAQFWSWIGWFPFLFYSTTWVGEIYLAYDMPAGTRESGADVLGEIGRIGSLALVIYSTVSFFGAFILPMVVRSPGDETTYTHRPPRAVAGLLERLNRLKPDLLTAWIVGHLMFATAMFMAPLARSFVSATVLMCLCGIPWAIAMWAPTAFLGIEVNKLSGVQDLPLTSTRRNSNSRSQSPSSSSSSGELSGIYFGILNIYTTLPQFIGTFISTIVFAVMEPGKSSVQDETAAERRAGGTNAIAVCLFIGAVSMLVAAHMTRKLRRL